MLPFWLVNTAYGALPADKLMATTASLGLQGIELCLHRRDNQLDKKNYSPIDYDNFNADQAARLLDQLRQYQLGISLSAYHRILGAPAGDREKNLDHLLKLIRIAFLLGGDDNNVCVGTFTGYDHSLGNEEYGFEKNLEAYQKVFTPIINYAASLGVTILYENCPMPAWEPAPLPFTYNNLPATLGARKLMYHLIPSRAHGETYDPSHDIWQFTDPCEVIKNSDISRIRRIHIKGTRLLQHTVNTHWGNVFPIPAFRSNLATDAGVALPSNPKIRYHHQPILPGYGGTGNIDWQDFTGTILSAGYQGPLVLENEAASSVGTKSEEIINESFTAAFNFLKPLVWKLDAGGRKYLYKTKELTILRRKDIPIIKYSSIQ